MPSKVLAASAVDDFLEALESDDVEVVNVQRSSTVDGETLVVQARRIVAAAPSSTPIDDGSCPSCGAGRTLQKLFEPKTGEMKCAQCGAVY